MMELSPGLRLHTKTLLERPFVFVLLLRIAHNERDLLGYGKF